MAPPLDRADGAPAAQRRTFYRAVSSHNKKAESGKDATASPTQNRGIYGSILTFGMYVCKCSVLFYFLK